MRPDAEEIRRHRARQGRRRRRGPLARLVDRLCWLLAGLILVSIAGVALLRFVPPPTSAFMIRDRLLSTPRDGTPVHIRHTWVSWPEISPYAALAVIAAEDQRFPEHHGFDLAAIREAIEEYRAGEGLRGASTISQQVAKNLFLWPGRSLLRKAIEAYFTALIELFWTKRRILEVYLNVAQFGDDVYGIAAASEAFFHRRPAAIGAAEAAQLAAVLPDPVHLHAARPSGYVRDRRDWILDQMQRLGGLSYLDRL